MEKFEGIEESGYYIVFKDGDASAAESFVKAFNDMKETLLLIAEPGPGHGDKTLASACILRNELTK